jgi:uncharacterized repeat protein (TIGR03803 family)
MRCKKRSLGLIAVLVTFAATLLMTGARAVGQETVLHNFNYVVGDGYLPSGRLISDSAGNLYGTTLYGGTYGGTSTGGTVFELTPQAGGSWTETVLHSFGSGNDGQFPSGGVVLDASGNLYGTTGNGGVYNQGTVFVLKHMAGGGWTEKTLHSFGGNSKGGLYPSFGVVFDTVGNLYGTAYLGGTHGNGVAFELTPNAGFGWTETVLHNFYNNGKDGAYPYANVILDGAGNLYGTTNWGGALDAGIVFELMPTVGGAWTEQLLHVFGNGKDGIHPQGSLILDASGNLYSTTVQGGAHTYGTVFELTPTASGSWTETILHSFSYSDNTDGYAPSSSLIFGPSGRLYGTTIDGGAYNFPSGGYGTVFELTPAAGGAWTETLLHSFNDNGLDGFYPTSSLIVDASGRLFGTTTEGGNINNGGTVFEITP